eukprot:GDKI01020663.1.p1 GENE.GDKI01020663.1~~GDKI01020663.1.p1  ORF type:complete len:264 (+),score=61.23 GDKI01020663.1:174-965(+)
MSKDQLRVGTFNIRYENDDDYKNGNGWRDRKQGVADLIRREKFAIVGLQEALFNQAVDIHWLLGGTPYKWVGEGRSDGQKGGELSPIFWDDSRLVLLEHGTFWLSDTPHTPGSKWGDSVLPRICTWGKFKNRETQKEFLFFNTHFDHRNAEVRARSARLIVQKISEIAGLYPAILVGDLNTVASEECYSVFCNSYLKDASKLATHAHPLPTFPDFHGYHTITIDYVFVSGWGVHTYRVNTDTLPSGKMISDHRAVVCDVYINV